MFGHQNTCPGSTVSSHEDSTKVAQHLRADRTHSTRSTLDNSPLQPLLLRLPRTVFRNGLLCINACKGGDAPLIPCAFTSVRALPLGNSRKFHWKKRGEGHFSPHAPACPRNSQAVQGDCKVFLSTKHNPALRGSVNMAKALLLPFLSPVKSKWMLPLGDHRREESGISDCFPPCNDNSALEQAVLRTRAKPAYLCFAIYDSFVL